MAIVQKITSGAVAAEQPVDPKDSAPKVKSVVQKVLESEPLTTIALRFCGATEINNLSKTSQYFRKTTPAIVRSFLSQVTELSSHSSRFLEALNLQALLDVSLTSTLDQMKNLTDLSVSYPVPDGLLESISQSKQCAGLRKLNLNLRGHSDHLPAILNKCQNLKILKLQGCRLAKDDLLALLSRSPDLEELGIRSCRGLTKEDYIDIAKKVKSLKILDFSNFDYVDMPVDDDVMAVFAKECPHLSALELMDQKKITESGILPFCKQLQTAELSLCRGISQRGFAVLFESCSQLSKLNLHSHCLDLTDLEKLLVHGKSQNLNLDWLKWSEREKLNDDFLFSLIPHVKNLDIFDTGGPMFAFDDPDTAKITDEGLIRFLQHCPHLRVCCLNGNYVSAKLLTAIAKSCPKLEKFEIQNNTAITPDDFMNFIAACPHLKEFIAIEIEGITWAHNEMAKKANPSVHVIIGNMEEPQKRLRLPPYKFQTL